MPRSVRDAKLDSRAAREKLKPRGKPYWRALDPGLHIGYRRIKGASGRWVIRHYVGDQNYEVETFATADDNSAANDVDVLDWVHAQTEARRRRDTRARAAAGKGPFTVADAFEFYIAWLAAEGRSTKDAELRAAMILPTLGAELVVDLTSEKLRAWLATLAAAPARLRTVKGEPQRYRAPADDDDEEKRRRRATANRHFTVLKAALNHAWREKKVPADEAWRRVKPFKGVDAARIRYLTVAEGRRLINSCDGDLRALVQAGLFTGARYSELARLKVADFNRDAGTLAIRKSKSGKARHIVLTEEGVALFAELCAGRRGDALLLRRADGTAWGRSHQVVRFNAACERAGITPAVGFHCLRHTWASLAVMAGMPLHVIGRNLGHRDTRMVEKHYGHLAPSYIADEVRRGAPRFGFQPDKKVIPL